MLPLNNRLKKVRDFNLLIKHGQWINGRLFNLKFVHLAKIQNYFPKKENPDNFKKQLKIAFSVGIKASKSAVKRNRLKRQAREVVRLILKDGKIKNGYYLMFTAKPEAVGKDYTEISQEIKLLLKKTEV